MLSCMPKLDAAWPHASEPAGGRKSQQHHAFTHHMRETVGQNAAPRQWLAFC